MIIQIGEIVFDKVFRFMKEQDQLEMLSPHGCFVKDDAHSLRRRCKNLAAEYKVLLEQSEYIDNILDKSAG